jgi:hypothetical protein
LESSGVKGVSGISIRYIKHDLYTIVSKKLKDLNIYLRGENMAEITEKEIKEHLNNLINALYALSPSRNYVLQLLNLLPNEYPKMVEAYPHLFKDQETRNRLKELLNIKCGEDITVEIGIGKTLKELSDRVLSEFFRSYRWDENQKKLSKYLGREMPNVIWEIWEQQIEMAILEPDYGTDCKKIFALMLDKGKGDQRAMPLPDVIKDTGIDESRLLRIKTFLAKDIKILEEREGEFMLRSELGKRTDLIQKHIGG